MPSTPAPKADLDGDGELTKAEFAAWHRTHFDREPSDAEWKQFHEADADRDGVISIQEAAAPVARHSFMSSRSVA